MKPAVTVAENTENLLTYQLATATAPGILRDYVFTKTKITARKNPPKLYTN